MIAKTEKHCWDCKQTKPISEFHKNKAKPDGLAAECKECVKHRVEFWQKSEKGILKKRITALRYALSPKGKLTAKKWRHTEKGKIYVAKRTKRMAKRHQAGYRARTVVFHAIRAGKLPNPKTLRCIHCPQPAEEYHHHKGYDVSHHLDVVPLCMPCHKAI